MSLFGREHKCPICKKIFLAYEETWVYRRRDKLFCSWGCMRKFDSKNKKAQKAKQELEEWL